MDCIILSRDRACQLDLLIRSIRKHFVNWPLSQFSVLYKSTSERFEQGYSLLKSEHPEFNYIKEQNFRDDLVRILTTPKPDKLMFLMDDNIFINTFDPLEVSLDDTSVACHSLRLCPRLNYCYMIDKNMKNPQFSRDLKWVWKGQDCDWGYPMSLDGHIFRTKQIVPWLIKLNWHSPNTAEANLDNLARSNTIPPKMSCFREAKIVNIVSNRVNEDAPNRIPTNPTDIGRLNEDFLNGARIQLPEIKNHNGCHIEYNYTYG